MNKPGSKELLAAELNRYNVDIVAITKTHLRDEGNLTVSPADGSQFSYKLYYSGLLNSFFHGVGFAIKSSHVHAVESFQAISERLAVLELNGTIPTDCDKDATEDAFFESIGQLLKTVPANRLMLLMGENQGGEFWL